MTCDYSNPPGQMRQHERPEALRYRISIGRVPPARAGRRNPVPSGRGQLIVQSKRQAGSAGPGIYHALLIRLNSLPGPGEVRGIATIGHDPVAPPCPSLMLRMRREWVPCWSWASASPGSTGIFGPDTSSLVPAGCKPSAIGTASRAQRGSRRRGHRTLPEHEQEPDPSHEGAKR